MSCSHNINFHQDNIKKTIRANRAGSGSTSWISIVVEDKNVTVDLSFFTKNTEHSNAILARLGEELLKLAAKPPEETYVSSVPFDPDLVCPQEPESAYLTGANVVPDPDEIPF